MGDEKECLPVRVIGDCGAERSHRPIAQAGNVFAAGNLGAERIAPPGSILVRPALGHVGMELAGPLAIVHAGQARQSLDGQMVRCGNDLGRTQRALERTGINGSQGPVGQAAGCDLSLHNPCLGQGHVEQATEPLILPLACIPGRLAVADEDNVYHQSPPLGVSL